MTVWDDLVGQAHAVEVMKTAVTGQGMSHAWLFTGPPGSGRSNAALALAAALQCEQGGCGECHACHTIAAGTHADVTVVRTEKLSIGVDEVRDLVRRSALAPAGRRWQIMIVEDADRLTEHACNALLKAIEEPTERTVWMLCAPTVEDVLPTIRSRCRLLTLATPTAEDVAAFLVRQDGVADGLAAYAARASQGHIGRARALARDEATRNRRREVVTIPARLTSLGACMTAATNLAEVTKEEADLITTRLDEREKADLDAAYGVVERGRRPREYAPALAALERAQKTRAKRRQLDVVDRGLMDLVSVYRDAIAEATGATGPAGQRGDPRRRRRGRPRLDARAQPAADRLDLPGPRADAGVQRPGAAGAREHDARAQGPRGQPVKKVVAWLLVLALVLGAVGGGSGLLPQPGRRRERLRPRAARRARGHPAADEPPDPALERFYAQDLDWSDCGDGDECATLTVPLDYADPAGETIGIHVLRRPADDQDDKVTSLLVNPGGPGVAGSSMASNAGSYFRRPFLTYFDIIGFDPRGTGQSSPIDCLTDEGLDDYLSGDPEPETPVETRAYVHTSRSMGRGCERLSPGLASHISTVEAARDMDVLRAALGEQVMTYYGASYGTQLGSTYAELFPERVGRLVLDGAVDPTLTAARRP